MLRRAAVLFDEPLDFLEARDDAFLARRAPTGFRLRLDAKSASSVGQFVEVEAQP